LEELALFIAELGFDQSLPVLHISAASGAFRNIKDPLRKYLKLFDDCGSTSKCSLILSCRLSKLDFCVV